MSSTVAREAIRRRQLRARRRFDDEGDGRRSIQQRQQQRQMGSFSDQEQPRRAFEAKAASQWTKHIDSTCRAAGGSPDDAAELSP